MEKISVMDSISREGDNISVPYRIPNNTKDALAFHALISTVDLRDPFLKLVIDVEVSDDGIKWRYFAGVVYVGGVYEPEGIPGLGISNGALLANKYVRIKVNSNKRINFGAEVVKNRKPEDSITNGVRSS